MSEDQDTQSSSRPSGRVTSSQPRTSKLRRQTGKSGKGVPKKPAGKGTQKFQKGGNSGKKGRRKSKSTQKPKEDKGVALEPIPQTTAGFPLWIKFAIPTAIIISALLILEGVLISKQMVKELDDQINKRGNDLVTQLAQNAPREFWAMQIPEWLEYEKGVAFKDQPKNIQTQIKNHTIEVRRKKQEAWKSKLAALAANSKKANEDNRQEIKAVLLIDYNADQTQAALVAGSSDENTSLRTKGPPTKIGDVQIFQGNFEGVLVREFRAPVMLGTGQAESFLTPGNFGWASVFLDAQAIEDINQKTRKNIYIISILGAIASVVIIVIIATIFTHPIRVLQDDISMVAEGNLDIQTSVATTDEIGALATVFNTMIRNLNKAQAQEADRKALERELNIANEIQTKLLPDRIPQIPGFDIHRYYASAKEVGGDYYDFVVIDQRHLGIVVADVSGKGIPGSMVMTMVRSLLRLASVRNFSPADTFKKVNRILHRDIRRGMFVTAIYMVLDIVDRKLKVASAGHNPLVVFRADSGNVELVKPKGIALGFDKGPIFDSNIKEIEIELHPGDRIVAYTDGVNEAMDEDEEEFGDDAFYNLVRKNASLSSQEFVETVVRAIEEHSGNAEQSDDITIATLAVIK